MSELFDNIIEKFLKQSNDFTKKANLKIIELTNKIKNDTVEIEHLKAENLRLMHEILQLKVLNENFPKTISEKDKIINDLKSQIIYHEKVENDLSKRLNSQICSNNKLSNRIKEKDAKINEFKTINSEIK